MIVHRTSGRAYVGASAGTLKRRVRGHILRLLRSRHEIPALQADWDVDGEAGFAWEILERCAIDTLRERESHWIGQYAQRPGGVYNRSVASGYGPQARRAAAGGGFLTVRGFAQLAGLHEATVREWLRVGRLKGYLPGGKKLGWRIPEGEVERFLRGEPQ